MRCLSIKQPPQHSPHQGAHGQAPDETFSRAKVISVILAAAGVLTLLRFSDGKALQRIEWP